MNNLGFGFVIYHSVGSYCWQIDDSLISMEDAANDLLFKKSWQMDGELILSESDKGSGYFIEPLTEKFKEFLADGENEFDFALKIPTDSTRRMYILERDSSI